MHAAQARWYALTMLISAGLLFMVQPMVGKLVLPLLGGTPAVWNTCMVFFQAMLLAGYAYVHWSVKLLGLRRQAWLHTVVVLSPLMVLPLGLAGADAAPSTTAPTLWLLSVLLVGVGMPFFVLSTTAPLLQKWFGASGHPDGEDPYFLYAASNTGSLIALLGYPLLMEPLCTVAEQSWLWALGYIGLLLLVVPMVVGAGAGHLQESCSHQAPGATAAQPAPALRLRLYWVAAAFVPSSLMLGTTLHITTNLAAMPMLWVVPLALYLATFIAVFARRPWIPHVVVARWMPMVILPLGALFSMSIRGAEWLLIPGHLLMFTTAALLCHGRLAATRPAAAHLTTFYLCMSIGGVLGGIFNGLIAPHVFTRVIEYPLVMVLACLFLQGPQRATRPGQRLADLWLPGLLAGVVLVLSAATSSIRLSHPLLAFAVLLAPSAMICFSFKERPLRFALAYGVVLFGIARHADFEKGRTELVSRSFFGVKRVTVDPAGDLRHLYHGTTVHGSQAIDQHHDPQPLTYYHREGPIGDVFSAYVAGRPARVGVVGLGAGAIAYYAEAGQSFTFYEIDPGVVAAAQDTRFFNYLEHCRGACDIVLGDGRLTLRAAPPAAFDVLVIDAFSSDAIPVHLVTREALRLYASRLADGGVLAFHISNRYLDLEPLLASLAADLGWHGRARADLDVRDTPENRGRTAAHYVAMSASGDTLTALDRCGWAEMRTRPGLRIWTDQYSNMLALFKWEP